MLCLLILYFDKVVIGCRDFFSFVPAVLFSILTPLSSSSSVPFFLFHSCCSHARVFGKTLTHEFHISYLHTEWYLLFSFFGARETKHAQRTLLQALFLMWPFKPFNLKYIYIFGLNLQAIYFYNNIIYYLIYPYFLYNITGEGA